MYKTGVEKQKLCVQTATKYKGSCIYVSRMGPDVVDVVLCTWLNVAVPSILNGCDMIPFCDTRIEEIERIQSRVAKFALGVSTSTSNLCAQSVLGMKPFRQLLYERQLKFYFRVLFLPESRWVHQALLEHLSGDWDSVYLSYISSVRSKLGLFGALSRHKVWKKTTYDYFLNKTNATAETMLCVGPLNSFSRLPYVSKNVWSSVITEFRMENEGLGNKNPRGGRQRKPFCPVCPVRVFSSGLHLLFCCSSLAALRATTGITSFMNQCNWKGLSLQESYCMFVNGYNTDKGSIPVSAYIERGKCMNDMRELWLSKW